MLLPDFDHWLNNLERLPSGSKIALFLLAWVIFWLPIALPLGKKLHWQPFQPLSVAQKLPLLVPLYLIVPLLAWFTVILERTTLSDYGLSWQPHLWVSLGLGIVMGVGGLGIIFGLESRLGWLKWHPENRMNLGKVALPILGLGLWVGITEEFVFRGIFQTILEQDYEKWVAAIIASSIFALVHLLWERKETVPQLPGLWIMGMVLVLARIVDGGSLGLAWGLHAGWVWGLASLDTAQMISYQDKSIEWMIGINKQPLAGVMGILCLLGTGLILWQWPIIRDGLI
ncbi:type II CAAX prenyl endopeptidase Rce1 family protein [Crocosphaera sp. UHCC 0190]|uniref:CPBP family intramembrane glutamic endopeptidase n=1 Tax=Crocosphaera sp. UHCC 0190 TaxID=3110246 RepID=UPI003A522E04